VLQGHAAADVLEGERELRGEKKRKLVFGRIIEIIDGEEGRKGVGNRKKERWVKEGRE
jgi:hypothetical protein